MHVFRCVEMSEPVSWRGAENLGLKQLACRGDNVHQPFYIRVRNSWHAGEIMSTSHSTSGYVTPGMQGR